MVIIGQQGLQLRYLCSTTVCMNSTRELSTMQDRGHIMAQVCLAHLVILYTAVLVVL